MKGIILAGGTGSRLAPLTDVFNKHVLPVGRYPMIVHPLMQMARAGIKEILIVTTVAALGDLSRTLGSGSKFGVDLTYRVQEQPKGIAQALALAAPFVQQDLCTVILGDNIFTADLEPYVQGFVHRGHGAQILVKQVHDPSRYGIAQIEQGRVTSIMEKPPQPTSNLAVTGIYMYDPHVFRLIETLQPSSRGEYEITDVNNLYIKHSEMSYAVLSGDWIDAGTFPSLARANEIMARCSYPELSTL